MLKKIAVVLVVLFLGAAMFSKSMSSGIHNEVLKKSIVGLKDGQEGIMQDIIPFYWERAYVFEPYTPKAEIEKTLGLSSPLIKESVSDDQVQWIFMEKGEITASVCAYPSDLGYDVELTGMLTGSTPYKAVKKDKLIVLTAP